LGAQPGFARQGDPDHGGAGKGGVADRGSVTHSYDSNSNQSGSSAGQSLPYIPADPTTSLKRAGGSALGATYAGLSQVERAAIASYAACTPTEEEGVADCLDYYRSDPEKLYTPGC
jgi:hypothetical protein